MISVCILSLGRASELRQVVKHNILPLRNSGINYEVLILDNGTLDDSVMDTVEHLKAHMFNIKYFRSPYNMGVAQGFNFLMRRAQYETIGLFGNDIILNPEWISYFNCVQNYGIIAIPCVMQPQNDWRRVDKFAEAPKASAVFGNWIIKKEKLKKYGLFNEAFKGYGLEDSELCLRFAHHGETNAYLMTGSSHLCNDSGQQTPYRYYKNKCLEYNSKIINQCASEGFKIQDNWDMNIESTYSEFIP